MDKEIFAAQMQGMATVLKGHKATDADWPIVMEIYWSKFQSWTNERFIRAVSLRIETSAFFPAISEVIEAGIQARPRQYFQMPVDKGQA